MITATFDLSADRTARRFDVIRQWLLERSMQFEVCRYIFQSRSLRNGTWYLGAVFLYLPLSLLAPMIPLLVGPILYGVPHLFSSFRFVHNLVGQKSGGISSSRVRKKFFFALAAICLLGVVGKILLVWSNSIFINQSIHQFGLETFVLLIVAVSSAYVMNLSLISALVVASLVTCLAFYSLTAALVFSGIITIAHNFVAFGYWIAAGRNYFDRLVAIAALVIFAAIHWGIFSGFFEPIYNVIPAFDKVLWNVDPLFIGGQVVPWTSHMELWWRGAVAFAFGQSIHYFVWLKVIPEMLHHRPVPASFSQSLRLLRSDFGKNGARIAILVCAVTFGGWLLLSFEQARLLYFAAASYHGYFEIAGLIAIAAKSLPTVVSRQTIVRG